MEHRLEKWPNAWTLALRGAFPDSCVTALIIRGCEPLGPLRPPVEPLNRAYSCLSASTGSISAARIAGYIPNNTPTRAEIVNATRGDQTVMIVFMPAA